MSKRKSLDERCGDRAAKQRKPHLYLVLDDWERGYSVRKLDVDAFDSDDGTDLPPKPFTEPPVARIEAPHVRYGNFSSHGTRILAMQPGEASPAIPAFDTRTLGMTVCPWPSCHKRYGGLPLFASAAGRLFVFMDVLAVYLGDPPPPGSKLPWSWTAMEAPPPFYASRVTCYALHPDGRTLFVSAASGTFSLDAESLEWQRCGDWLLPFTGQAFFDAELEAWVGLCGDADGAGYLCSCDVAPVAAEFTSPPSWKLGKDKLFREEPELHLGAKLLYMGASKFSLVELRFHKDDEHLLRDRAAPGRRRVLNVTTFGLKYNKTGQLRTMLRRASSCKMYKLPHDYGGSSDPLAFWL